MPKLTKQMFPEETRALQAQMYGDSTQKDRRAGQGVAVSFEAGCGQAVYGEAADQHDRHHCTDGRKGEDTGHRRNTPRAFPGGGEHQNRDQRFARAEDEDREEHPGGNVLLLIVGVDMNVVRMMRVLVFSVVRV